MTKYNIFVSFIVLFFSFFYNLAMVTYPNDDLYNVGNICNIVSA